MRYVVSAVDTEIGTSELDMLALENDPFIDAHFESSLVGS